VHALIANNAVHVRAASVHVCAARSSRRAGRTTVAGDDVNTFAQQTMVPAEEEVAQAARVIFRAHRCLCRVIVTLIAAVVKRQQRLVHGWDERSLDRPGPPVT
jgi:hypothetical protein